MEDLSLYAVEGYILEELKECSRTVQYFTDNTTNKERAEITEALGNLINEREIMRVGNIFKLKETNETIYEKS